MINREDLICVDTLETLESNGDMEDIKSAVDYTFDDKEVQCNMEYIKKETPFDGGDNDWVTFAKKQQEFKSLRIARRNKLKELNQL